MRKGTFIVCNDCQATRDDGWGGGGGLVPCEVCMGGQFVIGLGPKQMAASSDPGNVYFVCRNCLAAHLQKAGHQAMSAFYQKLALANK